MPDANGRPTIEDVQAERARRAQDEQSRRSLMTQAGGAGQPITLEAIRAERARRGAAPAPPPPPSLIRQAVESVGRFFSGEGRREEGAGEIAYQSVPEREGVRWEGGILSPALNALPEGARSWLDAQGRANAIGTGFFLDPNEEHRAEIIRAQVPTARFRRDEHNNLMVQYDEDTPWAYINRPGASVEDAQTLANEVMRYLAIRRAVPGGGRATPGTTSPLLTSTAREAAAGALSMAAGQGAATAVGGPGVDLMDVGVSAAGGAAGNVIGHTVAATVRGAPQAARQVGEFIADRLPGGAQRAAERGAAAEAANVSRVQAAQQQARETVTALAQQMNLTGERLAAAVANAERDAAERVAAELAPSGPGEGARNIDRMARELGINLTRSQTEFDAAGVRFLYDAAQGHFGKAAQKTATDFIEQQSAQIPAAMRNIAGDASIPNPQAGVATARAGMESMERAGQETETTAWNQFNEHADRYIRTFDRTPAGNPSGVSRVLTNLDTELQNSKVFLALPEYAEQFPRVASVMSLARRMNEATRGDLPIHDVDRVIQLKRFIDTAWEAAGTRTERRILTRMGTVARDWLRDAAGYNEGVPAALRARAGQTAGHLRTALAASEQNARQFRDNTIIQDMLERVRPNAAGAPEGTLAMTDQEVTRRIFGGGEAGLNVSGESLQALRVMKDVLGASSPEWQAMRQAAVQRLTANLDAALVTRQSMPIITAINNVRRAFAQNKAAMSVLFTPDEISRMQQWQEVLRSVAPPARNPANPSGTADTMIRVGRGMLQAIMGGAKLVPLGVGEAARATENSIAGARLASELSGAASPSMNIARAFSDLWNVDRNVAGAASAIGAANENRDNRAFR